MVNRGKFGRPSSLTITEQDIAGEVPPEPTQRFGRSRRETEALRKRRQQIIEIKRERERIRKLEAQRVAQQTKNTLRRKVIRKLLRQAEGKVGIFANVEQQRLAREILAENPQLRKAIIRANKSKFQRRRAEELSAERAQLIRERGVAMTPEGDVILDTGEVVSSSVFRQPRTTALPTPTEEELRQSLPEDIRGQPREFVERRVSIALEPVATAKEGGIIFRVPETSEVAVERIVRERREQREERIGGVGGPFTPARPESRTFSSVGGGGEIDRKGQEAFEETFVSGFLEGIAKDIKERPVENAIIFTASLGAGAGIKLVSTGAQALFGRIGVVAIERTVLGIGTGLLIKEGEKVVTEFQASQTIELKGEVVGRTLKDVGLVGVGVFLGMKGVTKTEDIIRTIGLKELPKESVIAPEFFEGQTFPLIKPGQTAGQLQKEFLSPLKILKETTGKARAFVSTPADFAKETVTRRGSSEVPGLFGSPLISPRFLRVESETRKLIGFKDFLQTGKPTAIRLELKTLEFQPGVTKKTPSPTGVFDKAFFESIIGTGRTIIPFAKTEKEAITSALTPIRQIEKEFFFKFSGRRIPIKTFEIVKGPTKFNGPKVINLKKVLKESSIGKIKSSPVISPVSLSLPSILRKSGISIPSSARKSGVSNLISQVTSKVTSVPVNKSLRLPPSRPPSRPPLRIPPFRPPPISPPKRPPIIPPRPPPSKPPIISRMRRRRDEEGLFPGFFTFVIRGGKEVRLPGVRPKGQALRFGAKEVKGTLRATFGVRPAEVKVRGKPSTFVPSVKIFRPFRIKAGKTVPLKDTFIQRTRVEGGLPGGRLQFKSERKAIQSALKGIKV